MSFKEKAIAALEELKGDSTGIIAATIEDCQRVIGEITEDASTFKPGMSVWVIERDEDGNAAEVSGYVFLAQCEEVVILSSYVNDYDFEGILAYHVQNTAEDYDTHLCVFPAEDCYLSRKECEAAFEAEQEGT